MELDMKNEEQLKAYINAFEAHGYASQLTGSSVVLAFFSVVITSVIAINHFFFIVSSIIMIAILLIIILSLLSKRRYVFIYIFLLCIVGTLSISMPIISGCAQDKHTWTIVIVVSLINMLLSTIFSSVLVCCRLKNEYYLKGSGNAGDLFMPVGQMFLIAIIGKMISNQMNLFDNEAFLIIVMIVFQVVFMWKGIEALIRQIIVCKYNLDESIRIKETS